MSLQHKVFRTANAPSMPPDETEVKVARALTDLENNVPELKAELHPLQISAAREVDVRGGKKAIVIFVPVPQLKAFHKVQARCVGISVIGRQFWGLTNFQFQAHEGAREKVLRTSRRVRCPTEDATKTHTDVPCPTKTPSQQDAD